MEDKKLTPVKAIRLKCLDCCAGQVNEVKMCEVTNCSLHRFRLGKNPNINKVMSDEEREACRERLLRARVNREQNPMERLGYGFKPQTPKEQVPKPEGMKPLAQFTK